MLRSSSLPRALAVVTAVLAGSLGATVVAPGLAGPRLGAAESAAADAPRDPAQPLVPRIRSITPDYIPDHGPIVVRGTLTNASNEEWTAINVEAFIGATPITTSAELAAAATTPVTADVGHRITAPGTFDTFETLQPGQTVRFTVRLPRSQLPVSAPGVYWFGVHALGATAAGSGTGAAGRDRTFLPLVPESASNGAIPVDAALVVPVRAAVTRGTDGSILDALGWMANLDSGALDHAADLGRAAHGRPLTWLLDPAVTDAVRALARGNPARSLTSARDSTSGNPSAGASPSADASASGTGSTSAGTAPSATAQSAARWLRRLHRVLANGTGEILGLPYGDLEVSAAARYDRPYLDADLRRTGTTLAPWKLPIAGPVVAPPGGRLTAAVVGALPRHTRVLLSDRGVVGPAPVVNRVDGRRVVLASTGAAEGGPGPLDPHSPLARRQRILSEAALHFLGNGAPLVVELPTRWRSRVPGSFFSGLDVPWLHLTTLDGAATSPPKPLQGARLRQPVTSSPGLGPEFFAGVELVLGDAGTLQSILPGNRVLQQQIFDETTGNTSYAAAADPFGATARVRSTTAWVRAGLDGITLAAPPSVTLTSTSGKFSVLVSNDLDVPVTVRVRPVADSHLKISGGETVQLPPHGRQSVLLDATTHVLGVHTVTLEVTNKAGTPLGSQDAFPMRAEQVSQLIWVIIGAGLALLFGAIVVRLVRRVRRSRA
ncbi:DUF6049 family protein [Nocardioides cynanchi]|uniref:DUF6049 family protein n=1 Tax=Nocardioides cynanchi TaxID=2558918 RepID=UPI0012452D3B|nr:DUF6049 family protein [Nocardioides cynanchi]